MAVEDANVRGPCSTAVKLRFEPLDDQHTHAVLAATN